MLLLDSPCQDPPRRGQPDLYLQYCSDDDELAHDNEEDEDAAMIGDTANQRSILLGWLFTEREGISHVAFGTWRGLAGGLAGESNEMVAES